MWGRAGGGSELKGGRVERLSFRPSPLLAGSALARLEWRGTQPSLSLTAPPVKACVQQRRLSREPSRSEPLARWGGGQGGFPLCVPATLAKAVRGRQACLLEEGSQSGKSGSLGASEAARQALGARSDREGKSPHCSASPSGPALRSAHLPSHPQGTAEVFSESLSTPGEGIPAQGLREEFGYAGERGGGWGGCVMWRNQQPGLREEADSAGSEQPEDGAGVLGTL